ncbi:ATPase [Mycolicibacterium pulveris]|uniref:ATPase n=1 Tax=Mycolicibacterium pulveris TaxID=36813 RepID=UPI003CF4AAFC
MAGRHRGYRRNVKKFARTATAVSAATATATALMAVAPPQEARAATTNVRYVDADLLAAVNPWPAPGQLPDATAGLGAFGYDITQTVVDFVARAVVENLNLAALARAAGQDPESLIEGLLGDPNFLVNNVLGGLLGEIPIDLSPVLDELVGGVVTNTILIPVLQLLGITDAQGVTDLLRLLGLVGLDLSDPLNLGNLDIPGLNTVTAGPVFTMLKLLGADLGWVPSLPNSVAADINATDYLEVGAVGLLTTLLEELTETLPGNRLIPLLGNVIDGLLGDVLPDAVHLRVPVSVGIGMGAFAIATGYDEVLAALGNQPGGADYDGLNPVLGSITVLPMLLLLNPARPNGGALARFYPLFDLFGIDTVNPSTQVTSSGGLAQLPLGLALGGATLIPVLIDVGVQYHPLSDLAAWPNPFSLANNLMAGLLPTYMLRGLTLETVTDQLTEQVDDALENLVDGRLALNLYATLPSATQPLLEPLYLLSDIISIATLGALAVNPVGMFANALAPAVQALNNLGYTDVVRNPDGTYTRTLTEGAVATPFLSFPSGINPLQVPLDIVNLLVRGFQKEFLSGNPTPATPNAILNLLDYLTGQDLSGVLPLSDLGAQLEDTVGDVVENLSPQQSTAPAADPPGTPSEDAPMLASSTDEDLTDDESGSDATDFETDEAIEDDEELDDVDALDDDQEQAEDDPDADEPDEQDSTTDTDSSEDSTDNSTDSDSSGDTSSESAA